MTLNERRSFTEIDSIVFLSIIYVLLPDFRQNQLEGTQIIVQDSPNEMNNAQIFTGGT